MADRAKTPPPAKKAPAKAPRRSLWMIGGIGALVAIVVAGGLIYLSQRSGNDASGGGSDAAQVAAGKLKGVDEVEKRFKGIPQDGAILGDPNATVTITEFADLRCTACYKFELDYFPAIIEKLIRTGKAKYEFQLWPILGIDSVLAAEAGIAAREQDMLYQYSDLWYINQQDESMDYATDAYVDGVAKALGLDLPAFHITGRALTEEQLEFALSKAGQPYSYWECIKAYFGKNDSTNQSWECAEYVAAVLGLTCLATPASIVNHLLDNGSTLTAIQP